MAVNFSTHGRLQQKLESPQKRLSFFLFFNYFLVISNF